jgi:hypothetical protein
MQGCVHKLTELHPGQLLQLISIEHSTGGTPSQAEDLSPLHAGGRDASQPVPEFRLWLEEALAEERERRHKAELAALTRLNEDSPGAWLPSPHELSRLPHVDAHAKIS